MSPRPLWIIAGIEALLALGLHLYAGGRIIEAEAEIVALEKKADQLQKRVDSLAAPRKGHMFDGLFLHGGSPVSIEQQPPAQPPPPTATASVSDAAAPGTPAATPKQSDRPPPDPAVILEILAKYADLVEEGKYAELYGYFTEDFRMQLMFGQGITSAEDFSIFLGNLKRDQPFVFQGLAGRLNPKILSRASGWGVVEVDSPFSGERDTWYLKEEEDGWKIAAAAESPTAEIEHNETQAKLALNLLSIAQLRFAESDPDHDGSDFATTFDELATAPGIPEGSPLLPADLVAAANVGAPWGGYYFGRTPLEADGRGIDPATDFAFWAAPADYGRSGKRIFITRRGTGVLGCDRGDGAPMARWPGDPKSPEGWGE